MQALNSLCMLLFGWSRFFLQSQLGEWIEVVHPGQKQLKGDQVWLHGGLEGRDDHPGVCNELEFTLHAGERHSPVYIFKSHC